MAHDLGADLATSSDELNQALTEAETILVNIKLGVRASVLVEECDGVLSFLAFGKEKNNTWRLLWETSHAVSPNDRESTPLVNTRRATRVRAAELLPALRVALILEAEKQLQDVRAATEKVRLFLGRIR